MLKATWRRSGSPICWAIGFCILVPGLAEAQLFPNRAIRRERPPCSSEPPFNAQVRRDYFGYYPTCWSKFPEGWACPCPNPELPNAAESFRKQPLGQKSNNRADLPPEAMDEENPEGAGDRMPANPAGDEPKIPLPNPSRSPFDLEPNPKPQDARPGGDPANPGPRTSTGRPNSANGLMEMPKLPATTPTPVIESNLQPGSMAMMPEATLASTESSDLRADLGPLPSMASPASSLPTTSAAAVDLAPTTGFPTQTQAPRRRGFLSGLFGSGNTRKR